MVKKSIILFDELYNIPGWDVGEYKALTEVFSENEYKFIAFLNMVVKQQLRLHPINILIMLNLKNILKFKTSIIVSGSTGFIGFNFVEYVLKNSKIKVFAYREKQSSHQIILD